MRSTTRSLTVRTLLWAVLAIIVFLAIFFLTACSEQKAVSTAADEKVVVLEKDTELHFGDSYNWPDGLSVSVLPAETYEPSDSALVQKDASYVSVEFVLTNTSDSGKDISIYTEMKVGDNSADKLFDIANGVEGPPTVTLSSNETVKWTEVYSASISDDLNLSIRPTYTADDAVFRNK